ncbi:putative tubby-like protein [Helianthus annuus]|nr:putative tubby-like protein [Helianthus annuus]KAJ0740584.1 putative tubby-like protein [Helianthus annuus]
MAQPIYAAYTPSPYPVSVIGSQFIAPYPFEAIIVINSSGDLLITDVNHKILFKVKPCNTNYHNQRVLLDVDDRPIVLMREKTWTVHNGWKVFKGDSNSDSDLIFSTKTPKIIQSKTHVHVFLGSNTSSKGTCDFKITGSWSKRSCAIYVGDSSTVIAQMHKMEPPESVGFVKDKFMVTIYPYVDYAFVVTLIAIVEAMNSSDADDDVIEEVIGSVFG